VKNYLVGKGISAARLSTLGAGEDPKTSGEEALTIKARRVEVAK
jgi:OOP family OmpA-OmpF porin